MAKGIAKEKQPFVEIQTFRNGLIRKWPLKVIISRNQ